LSSPHLEASPATTFRACSSPAPTLNQACNAGKIYPDKSLAKSLIKNIFKIFSAI
jgi:hypothetical protein